MKSLPALLVVALLGSVPAPAQPQDAPSAPPEDGRLAGADRKPTPWSGPFALRAHDVVAFAGGTGMVTQMRSGSLEAILTAASDAPATFRDIAWQADTVFQQQRPRAFGTQGDLLRRLKATVVVANFGQMEVLAGTTEVAAFIAAYETLLSEIAEVTQRIVLIPPHPFDAAIDPLLPSLATHNGDVAAYAEAIRQLAERRGFLFVDLAGFNPDDRTTDGVHLTPAGQDHWAAVVASQLLHQGTAYAPALDPLRELIRRKNQLWRQHWRPTNWAFLYGDRQHVPSSHDHRPGEPRWFPREVDGILPLIEAQEARIHSLQKESR